MQEFLGLLPRGIFQIVGQGVKPLIEEDHSIEERETEDFHGRVPERRNYEKKELENPCRGPSEFLWTNTTPRVHRVKFYKAG